MAEEVLTTNEISKEKLLTFSNALSVLRVVCVPFFIWSHQAGENSLAMIIFAIAVASDWFDGKVARWTNTVSDLGKILDPLADKITGILVAGYAAYINEIPFWFLFLLVIRDGLIFSGGIYAKRKKHLITTSLWAGKVAVGFLAGMLAAALWREPFFDPYLSRVFVRDACMWISLFLLLYSFGQYAVRFYDILKGKPVKML
ncbi:MAG: CDP-alcohol phosphatidyltransferase family protein [Chloroherpetonaceae bacterium]|nr:CDP-alcohol phosphatidyltransferase family protein [Chloroherpetonaceae bacterium]